MALAIMSCSDVPEIPYEKRLKVYPGPNLVDIRDNKTYGTVIIGSQVWMAENLNLKIDGISACYANLAENCSKYGALYYWVTAMEICPEGWFLPSNDDWEELTRFVGGQLDAGYNLKAESGWQSDGNGIDKFGFAAVPAGFIDKDGYPYGEGYAADFWSSMEVNDTTARGRMMIYSENAILRSDESKMLMLSVRCLRGLE
ncbi:MAG: fibrobacter succinogenes major paralogous domain-containing protein [Fibromonadales bacterium]|nr:fibrobacter succinogenes major paralogous domain-containing protein [Fibromonadales bacterium]